MMNGSIYKRGEKMEYNEHNFNRKLHGDLYFDETWELDAYLDDDDY